MDERRLKKFFRFTEEDLFANRRGQFSEHQTKRLGQEAKAQQASARSSAAILFLIAAAGLAIGLTIGFIAPTPLGRILMLLLMGILWPFAWAAKGVSIIRSANALQAPRLRQVSGRAHIVSDGDGNHILQVGEFEFDMDGNPSGVIMEGDEYAIHCLEATDEILSLEYLIGGK